jgi:vacuolar protein sorting-associated protein 11
MQAYRNLMKYATVLLENCSKDSTQLFINYYTGKFRPKKDAVVVAAPSSNNAQQGIGGRAATAVQNLAAMLPLPYMSMGSSDSPASRENAAAITVVETNTDDPPAKYPLPKPRTAFSAFVDHPQQLITFLEACIQKDDWKEEDEADLYTTLFEVYVQTANTKKDEERSAWENKAKSLIESKKVSYMVHVSTLSSNKSRFPWARLTFSCSPIFPTFVTVPFLFVKSKVFALIYSDPIRRQRIPLALLRHCTNMAPKNLIYILQP